MKRDEETEEWRKLHNEELNVYVLITQYCTGNQIEKNEMGGACSAYGGGERRVQDFGGETWENPGVDGRIILRWVFRTWDVRVWTGSSWLKIGTGGGHL
jgi:hypothetical protein